MDQKTVSIEKEHPARHWDETAFNRAFRHEVATAGDVRIHYVIGGNGPLVALLHGFPQHWREWRLIMPLLTDAGYTVVAPELRGFGYSDKPLDGFDVGTVAEDVRQIIEKLGRGGEEIRIVGHDVGAAVSYAWAAAHREQVEQLVLMEGLPAGLESSGAATPMLQGKPLWHLAFGMTPDVPERLLADHERIFVEFLLRRGCYDPLTFSDEEIDAYTRPFAALGGVRGAFAHIRAIPRSAALNRTLSEKDLEMPVLAIGAELSFGKYMAEGARRFARRVSGAVAERCGHWIPEERPDWLSGQLVAFFGAEPLRAHQVA
jgi:pimeloyl-ACP methyl ester carboxylesterase